MEITSTMIQLQEEYMGKVRQLNRLKNMIPKACVITYGCQQNENDSEKIRGFLTQMGYEITKEAEEADLILYNTCAVREGAEDRVFGNLGALKHRKAKNEDLIIGLCGCMAQQEEVASRIKASYRHVDFLFGTHTLYRFPQTLYEVLSEKSRKFDLIQTDGAISEGLPQIREDRFKASVSIMYGCNNFCTYCIVPYVRGRERSRKREHILAEIKDLAKNGYREITLLGQNVNSYGKDLGTDYDFSDLLSEVNQIEGIRRIRFMTSHPKDVSDKLIETIAACENVPKYLHLPFQAGSNRILNKMNRSYTKEQYLTLIEKVKKAMPGIALTSDVIVGFPGETGEDFLETLDVVKTVGFDSLFTFIFSKRKGTPAEKMEDPISAEEKHRHFEELLSVQNEISKRINDSYVGGTYEVLVEGESKNNPAMFSGRTPTNKIVNFAPRGAKAGDFVQVKITGAQTWALLGEQL